MSLLLARVRGGWWGQRERFQRLAECHCILCAQRFRPGRGPAQGCRSRCGGKQSRRRPCSCSCVECWCAELALTMRPRRVSGSLCNAPAAAIRFTPVELSVAALANVKRLQLGSCAPLAPSKSLAQPSELLTGCLHDACREARPSAVFALVGARVPRLRAVKRCGVLVACSGGQGRATRHCVVWGDCICDGAVKRPSKSARD